MSETSEVVRPLIEALRKAGIYADRYQAGKVRVRGGWMQLHREGTPDVGGFLRDGRAFFIECKVRSGKLREAQRQWMTEALARRVICLQCHAAGQIAEVVRHLLAVEAAF